MFFIGLDRSWLVTLRKKSIHVIIYECPTESDVFASPRDLAGNLENSH